MARCCDPPSEGVCGRALARRPRGERLSYPRPAAAGTVAMRRLQECGDPPRGSANGPPDHKESELLMARKNPTDGGRAVALSISSEDRKVPAPRLHHRAGWHSRRAGQLSRRSSRADASASRKDIYEELLAALGGESIDPDHYMRQMLRDLMEMNDRENEYARVVAEHEALLSLRKQLGEGRRQ